MTGTQGRNRSEAELEDDGHACQRMTSIKRVKVPRKVVHRHAEPREGYIGRLLGWVFPRPVPSRMSVGY